MKTTRRELGIAAAAAALALKADAQAPPLADPSKLVHDLNQRNSETLAKFEIPIATEPAFRFEP
jgi:hypothetical protein